MSRIIRPFGQNKRNERVEPSPKAFRPALRETGNPVKKPERESIRISAFRRIPLWVLILSCVAVAVIISVSLFSQGNGGSNTKQAMAVLEAGKESAPQTSNAPDAASVSTEPSAAPASSPSASPSAAPASSPSGSPSAAPASSPLGSDSSDPGPLGSIVFKQGMSDPLVAIIQQRLMDLNYLGDAPTTELYGPLTQAAVMSFQRAAGLPTDGNVGSETYTMLMSENAPPYAVGLGAQGTDVEDMISRLHKLGYIDTTPDTFTAAVKTAVEKFQKANGLVVDGTIGESTKEMLFSDHAKAYSNASASGNQSSSTNVTGSITQKTNLKPAKLEAILPSALKGLGQALYNGEQQYKINSLFILSIIDYESGNGTSNLAQHQNNLGGIKTNGTYRAFSTKEECIDYMYNLLRTKYVNAGLTTIPEIGTVYCTGNTWATNVTGIMQDLISECS